MPSDNFFLLSSPSRLDIFHSCVVVLSALGVPSNSMGLLRGLRRTGTNFNPQKRLIEPIDELLKLLTEIIVRILHEVTIFDILLPEPPRPDEHIRHADRAGLAIGEEGNEFDHVVEIGREVLRGFVVVVVEEEQSLRRQARKIVCPAVREVTGGRAVVQLETAAEFLFQPLLGRP